MMSFIVFVLLLSGHRVCGVTGTNPVAETEITFSVLGNDTILSCHILPCMLDRTVHYCRWIRPDGYGIHNDISHRYTANSSDSECRLVILNYREEEDDGNWTCVVGLKDEKGHLEEIRNNIKIYHMILPWIYFCRFKSTTAELVIGFLTLISFICIILILFVLMLRFI